MSRTKTTAAKSGNTTNTTSRVNRWRKCAEKRLATICTDCAAIIGALAELNELEPVDFVVRTLCRERGLDADAPIGAVSAYLEEDEYYENTSTRSRNAHDMSTVTIFICTHSITPANLTTEEALTLIRRYGCKGDSRTDDVLTRVIRAAIAA